MYRHNESVIRGGAMNNRRKLVIALGAGTLTAPFGSFAQQQDKVWRIGLLSSENPSGYKTRIEALRVGCATLATRKARTL